MTKNKFLIHGTKCFLVPSNTFVLTLIDREDIKLLSNHSWYLDKSGYLRCTMNKSHVSLHRFILGLDSTDKRVVDHINNSKLDNRKSNLRVCTYLGNNQNRGKYLHNTSSKYKGVSWNKYHKKWVASSQVEGKRVFIGYFDDEEECAKAYDEFVRRHHGEFAKLNYKKC